MPNPILCHVIVRNLVWKFGNNERGWAGLCKSKILMGKDESIESGEVREEILIFVLLIS